MVTNIDDIIKKANAKSNSNLDFEFPRCTTRWCSSNLPATKSIPMRSSIPDVRLFRSVCENCYYDYEFEGIETWSITDEELRRDRDRVARN
jgi:hypothetical protein